MEEGHLQPEHGSEARYAVDADASLVIFNHGGTLRARILELSLSGCRARADRYFAFSSQTGVEVTFKINGIGFRLAGTMEWLDAQQTAGIQFSPMAPRRREALEDLLNELEAKKQAEEQAKNKAETQAEGGADEAKAAGRIKPGILAAAKAGILTMPASSRRSEITSMGAPPGSGPMPPRDMKHPTPISRMDSSEAVRKAAEGHKPLERPTGRERREEARHCVDTHATVFFIDVRAQITGRILDLSMSGCRIRTDERFPVGIYRRVETEFKLDGLPFRLGGVIQALHDKFTVGIRFLDLSPRKRDQLAQLMEEIAEMRSRDLGRGH